MNTTKPVIARIRGTCIGGGLGFAAACDLRICSEDSIFRMPAARLGLGYSPAGVRRFMSVLGAANTTDIFASARKFDAKEALRMGFVSKVCPPPIWKRKRRHTRRWSRRTRPSRWPPRSTRCSSG
jgi:enoyl-CoA hydratase/carnithine racemase